MPSSIRIQYFSFCVDTAYQWTSEAMHMYISTADVGEAKATLGTMHYLRPVYEII